MRARKENPLIAAWLLSLQRQSRQERRCKERPNRGKLAHDKCPVVVECSGPCLGRENHYAFCPRQPESDNGGIVRIF